MRIVVEAHADDAYLSVGSFLRDWAGEEPLMIVTVFSGTRSRSADAGAYADAIGADWLGLGLTEGEPGNIEGSVDLPDVAAGLAELSASDVTMIGPLGLGHPEHRGVAAALPPGSLRYVDLPIAARKRVQAELAAAAVGMTVEAVRIAAVADYGDHAIFRDQARFMLFNAPRDLARLPQVVLR